MPIYMCGRKQRESLRRRVRIQKATRLKIIAESEARYFFMSDLESAPDAIRTHDTFFRREVLYPLSYRGNGNYCTTKCDSGRSLLCRLGPCVSWRG